MKIFKQYIERIVNFFRLYQIKKNKVIETCIQHDIPLTKKNIDEVEQILSNHKIKFIDAQDCSLN